MERVNIRNFTVFADSPFAKRIIYQDGNIVSFTLNFKPGQTLPPHTHFESTVVVAVYEGNGEAIVDGKTLDIGVGDIVTVKGDETLSLANMGTGNLSVFVNMAPRPEDARYSRDIG